MSWEHIDIIFPEGMTPFNGNFVPNQEIRNMNIPLITLDQEEYVRNMKVKNYTQAWGENGEYAEGVNYDLYRTVYHPDLDHLPLNDFGQTMVNNYFYFNDVEEIDS